LYTETLRNTQNLFRSTEQTLHIERAFKVRSAIVDGV